MFMFVFAMIVIAIVGLFFQVVTAMSFFMSSQMLGVGEQLFMWQSLAVQHACSAGLATPGSTVSTKAGSLQYSDITSARPTYHGYNWETVIFDGTYGTAPTRIVLSYISPGTDYGGHSSSKVVQQFRRSFKTSDYRFSAVYSSGGNGAIDVTVATTGGTSVVTLTGIPTAGGDAVPLGASAVFTPISSTGCP